MLKKLTFYGFFMLFLIIIGTIVSVAETPPIDEKITQLGPYSGSHKYYIHIYNIDDVAKVIVNGNLIQTIEYRGDSGWVEITSYLSDGDNEIEFTVENGVQYGGWSYGLELRQDGSNIILKDSCGSNEQIPTRGCKGPVGYNEQTGLVYRNIITLKLGKNLIGGSAAAPTESSNSFLYTGIGGLVILLIAIMVLKRRSSSQEKEHPKPYELQKPVPEHKEALSESRLKRYNTVSKTEVQRVEALPQVKPVSRASGIDIKTIFGYKGATIIFKIKLENNTPDPISDIKVYPYVPDVFLLKEKEKSIALIEPKSSQTVTFEIRPTGECGDCYVSGRINYYDMALRKRQDIELESKSLSIVCPMLHGKEISEAEWHDVVSNLMKAEENTKEIDMPAETLFTMVSRIVKDMHMHMHKPEVTQNQRLFNGVAHFYGEGVKGLRYAAQVEVVGGEKKSRLLLKAWAEKEDALTGFYHGILDEIEKRINVKGYIDDSIVQQYIHIGDKIGTQVKDSFVQRSTVAQAQGSARSVAGRLRLMRNSAMSAERNYSRR